MISIRNLYLLLALSLVICVINASCRGRVRDRIEDRPPENVQEDQNGDGAGLTAERGRISDAEISFDYPEESLYSLLTAADIIEDLPIGILSPSYTLFKLTYQSEGDEVIGWVTLPLNASDPFPTVLMLHGHNASKDMMTRRYGSLLAANGIASISIDLPLQGERALEGEDFFSGDPEETAYTIRQAVIDARRAIDYIDGVNYFDCEKSR